MVLFGTLINALLIIVGAIIGRFLKEIPENMKETVMYGIGTCSSFVRYSNGLLKVIILLLVIISIVVGGSYWRMD